uniref:Acid phosphatase n=1 Tax=Ditylenchus dipsaci TaxID=166011 RepID=A0A915CXK1_9BILA
MRRSFFPVNQKSTKNSVTSWRPVPIYTAPDHLIKPTSFDCPKYNKLREAIMPAIIANISSKYDSFFKYLGNVSGFGDSISFEQVLQIYDISREIANGLPQPDWVYKIWKEYDGNSTLELLKEMQRLRRFHENSHENFSYLRGGFLLGEWLTRLKNVTKGIQYPPTKMALYSSHDGTLQALMHILEVSNYQLIPYAACIFMEVYKNKQNDYEIELYLRDSDGNLDVIIPYNCTFPCPLNEFLQTYEPKAIFSFRRLAQECELKNCLNEASVSGSKGLLNKNDD